MTSIFAIELPAQELYFENIDITYKYYYNMNICVFKKYLVF